VSFFLYHISINDDVRFVPEHAYLDLYRKSHIIL